MPTQLAGHRLCHVSAFHVSLGPCGPGRGRSIGGALAARARERHAFLCGKVRGSPWNGNIGRIVEYDQTTLKREPIPLRSLEIYIENKSIVFLIKIRILPFQASKTRGSSGTSLVVVSFYLFMFEDLLIHLPEVMT